MPTDTPPPSSSLTWQNTPFHELTADDLYAALQLRQRVFVVEQKCVYMDLDDADQKAVHLLGWHSSNGKRRLVAYARLLPPGLKYVEPSIGRVITHPEFRGTGAGRVLMGEAIRCVGAAGWGSAIYIAAQLYLERFYEGFGFKRASEPYTEDDIWHVDMRRA